MKGKHIIIASVVLLMSTTVASAAKIKIAYEPVCSGSGLGHLAVFKIEIQGETSLDKIVSQLNNHKWKVSGPLGSVTVHIPAGYITPEMLKDDSYLVIGGDLDQLKRGMIIEYPVPLLD